MKNQDLKSFCHGRKDENKILMATESTEEHRKIRSQNLFATEIHGIKNA